MLYVHYLVNLLLLLHSLCFPPEGSSSMLRRKLLIIWNIISNFQFRQILSWNLILLSKIIVFYQRGMSTLRSMPVNVEQCCAEIGCYNKRFYWMKQIHISPLLQSIWILQFLLFKYLIAITDFYLIIPFHSFFFVFFLFSISDSVLLWQITQ